MEFNKKPIIEPGVFKLTKAKKDSTIYLNKNEYYQKIERLDFSFFDNLGFGASISGKKPTFEEFAQKNGFSFRLNKEGTHTEKVVSFTIKDL